VLVASLSLLIGGILAALRQVFHLSSCPNLPGHLSISGGLSKRECLSHLQEVVVRLDITKGTGIIAHHDRMRDRGPARRLTPRDIAPEVRRWRRTSRHHLLVFEAALGIGVTH
jgi:hypothetical protein